MTFTQLLALVQSGGLRVTADSRRIQPGDVFVAVRGTQVDGHDYIEKALASGAGYIVTAHPVEGVDTVVVEDTAKALGILAQTSFDNPSSKLTNLAVTGTNGKTTTLDALLRDYGTEILGAPHVRRYGNHLASVMKILDGQSTLSAQRHPAELTLVDDKAIPPKSEFYFPFREGGSVYLGWSRDVSEEELRRLYAHSRVDLRRHYADGTTQEINARPGVVLQGVSRFGSCTPQNLAE